MHDKDNILGNLVRAIGLIEDSEIFCKYIPEVRTNIAYALPNATSCKEVAAIEGRITVVNNKPKACGYPKFGASSHLARAIIEMIKENPRKRAAINIKGDKEFAKYLKSKIKLVEIDRSKEPKEVSKKENLSTQWKVREALKKEKKLDAIYSFGAVGKEDIIVLFGEDAYSLVKKILLLIEEAENDFQ